MTEAAGGAIVLGKTDTTEFAAAGRNAATRNPWSLDHTPGGSSSGSAAAVAGFQVPLALGTQTGGSTIRPASFCGVFAMKPTWGAVSREGLKLYSITLDTLGWFGRGVADLGLICDALEIDDDEQHAPPSRPRIALCRTPSWPWAAPETAAAMDRAAALLDAAGVELHELTLPDSFDDLVRAHQIIMFLEGRAAFLTLARTHAETLHDDFHLRVDNREGFSRADLRNAYDLAARCRAEFDGIARAYDAVLTPSAPGEAPLGTIPGDPVFNSMWTLLHTPCVNIPAFRSQGGLPVGLTLTGPRFSDRGLLATAQNVSDILLAAGDWRIAPPDQDAELRILTASR
jgi:Asp-tRNA(Asn)/Glu-tRNA(Gln) amidotransferase A subunit family amidase